MGVRVDTVFAGFLNLSVDERSELIQKINEYQNSNYEDRKLIKEGHQRDTGIKMDLGPLSDVCGCCGR